MTSEEFGVDKGNVDPSESATVRLEAPDGEVGSGCTLQEESVGMVGTSQ
jgi:hypothetical protein